MPTAAAKVLICDQAEGFRHQLQDMLEDAGAVVVSCAAWHEVAALAERECPDAILGDVLTPSFDVDALVGVRNAAPDALLAVVSSLARADDHSGEATGGIDLVLSRRDPPGVIVAALLEHLAAGR